MNQAKGIEILKCCHIPEHMTELAERLSIGLLPMNSSFLSSRLTVSDSVVDFYSRPSLPSVTQARSRSPPIPTWCAQWAQQ